MVAAQCTRHEVVSLYGTNIKIEEKTPLPPTGHRSAEVSCQFRDLGAQNNL